VSRWVLALGFFLALVLGAILKAEVHIPSFVIAACGAVGVLGLFLTGFVRPEVPLYVLAAYLPFSKALPGAFGRAATALNLTNLLFLAVIVASVFDCMARRRPLLEFHRLHVTVAMLAAWGCLSYVLTALAPTAPSDYAQDFMGDLKRWLDPFVVYLLFFQGVRRGAVWRNVVGIVMVVVVVVAGLAVYDYIGIADSSLDKSRVGGVVGQPNYLGAFFVYYMFLFAGHWIQRKSQPSAWLLLLPFLLCFRGIMVTFSRGAYLAFAQGVLGLAYYKKRVLALVATGALVFVALNPWLLPAGIRYRLDTTFESKSSSIDDIENARVEDLDASSAIRLLVWQGGLQMVRDSPVFGVGFGQFPYVITNYVSAQQLGDVRDAHNAYLITAAELGVPALLLLLLNFGLLFWLANRIYKRHPDPFVHATALGYLGGLSALLVANLFGSRLNTTEVAGYVWLLAGLMARADVGLSKDRSDGDPLLSPASNKP
jgi:O-antigen ligase